MTEHEVRKIGVFLAHDVFEQLLVLHHGMRTGIAPIAPCVVENRRRTMANVIVCGNNETSVHQGNNHMEVTTGVLTETMNELHDAFGLACRNVNPTNHLIASI